MRALPALLLCLNLVAAQEVLLWPEGVPGAEKVPDTERVETRPNGQRSLRNVSRPRLEVLVAPPEKATGGAVIVCPGGGFVYLELDKEGHEIARWLNQQGLTAFVLRYRVLPTQPGEKLTREEEVKRRAPYVNAAIEDATRAVHVVRSRAREWNVDPKRIGIMGFSAGGVAAAGAGVRFDADSRPDAVVAIYPGRYEPPSVPANAPPLFVVHATDDRTVPVDAAVGLYNAWNREKASAELHVFSSGGHGFGLRKMGSVADRWTELLTGWLAERGWLRRP
jgi:acetyl esterase/lipase